MPDTLTPTARLEIERACEKLIHTYSRALDQGDMDAAADCFAAQGTFARPMAPDQLIVGREAIRASLHGRPATLRTRHLSTNVIVEVEGSRSARAVSYLVMVSTTPAPGAMPPHESQGPIWFGEMHDRFVHEDSAWKFIERRGSIQMKHMFP